MNHEADTAAPTTVVWDLDPLLAGGSVDSLLEQAEVIVAELEPTRGRVAALSADELLAYQQRSAELGDVLGRAGSFAGLRHAANTDDEAAGALLQRFSERAAQLATRLLFFELEWVELPDERVDELLADPRLDFCAHSLRMVRRYRPHVLTEAEEKILTEFSVTGWNAWVRLFDDLTSAIEVALPDPTADGGRRMASLEEGLSLLGDPDRARRQEAAEAVTAGLRPGIRTRAFVLNTLMGDKSTQDRLRHYPTWVSARNLSNEASDASVAALVDAVVGRYDIARRWYRLKARILGVARLADYDRMASLAETDARVPWDEAVELVVDSYASFSDELADGVRQFLQPGWIDAPVRAGKRPGAFCAYTVPSHHPYLFLNWTGRRRDVLTLAHELGHGLHAMLAAPQGIFHQSTGLTLAETASVFGETVTFGRLLEQATDPNERLSLLAESVEGAIATVFRQVAMNRFEHAMHTERREIGELSVERFGELWAQTQEALLGDAVEVTDNYRLWWSYIPHFVGSPGYVYAYAYGQLLAMSVYQRYTERGAAFIPQYLELLRAGGSLPPEALGRIVDCDLEDPGFWEAGLDLIDQQVTQAEAAAVAAGRLGS
jgi:oligoendopeptidase F